MARRIGSRLGNRQFLHFEYQLVRLFDFQARDYYDHGNPIVKILLPKMSYPPGERWEVIRRAYLGLFELVSPMLFDKYADFIDVYAEVREDEREVLYREIAEQEDTAMLAQYIRDKGFQEGKIEGKCIPLERQLTRRFGPLPKWVLEATSIQEVLAE